MRINNNFVVAILFIVIGSCSAAQYHDNTQLKIAELECAKGDLVQIEHAPLEEK